MRQVVQEILAARSGRSLRRQQTVAASVAVFLHLLVVGAAVAVPLLTRHPPRVIEYVEVHVLPPQALGVERPPQQSRPEPEPAPPEPEPPPRDEEPALPPPEAKPEPEKKEPPPRSQEPARPAEPEGPEGSSRGAPGGTSRLGAEVLGPDGTAFAYDYYLEQMLSQIRRSWARPPMEGVRALVSFKVLANGEIREIEVREPSGSRAFDLAAIRAVRNASPLPPLPASYRKGSLTVNLIVR